MRVLNKANTQVRIYRDAEELALHAARHFERMADAAITGAGRFTVALSGGSTPKAIFALLAREPFVSSIAWPSIYFFWVDERCVPTNHPDSNYRLATQTLLSRVRAPGENVFRIPAEMTDPERAAENYSATLRQFFVRSGGTRRATAPLVNWPRFDLVFLGMGADGHTASLFPGTAALEANSEIAVANYVPKLKASRITLTATTINNARNVTFVVSGDEKAEALKQVLEGNYEPERFPSQLVRPRNGPLLWMVDEAAARLLES